MVNIMTPTQSAILCKMITESSRKYNRLLKDAAVPEATDEVKAQLTQAAMQLEEGKKEIRLAIMNTGAEKVKLVQQTTGGGGWFRSKSSEMLADKILEKKDQISSGSEIEFLQIISNALNETKRERTDKPNTEVGLYKSDGSLSYGGELVQQALESYVMSKLSGQQLDGIDVLGLDFSSVDIKNGTDETSQLFRDFVTLVTKRSELTDEDKLHFDKKVSDFIANQSQNNHSLGDIGTYTAQGKQSFEARYTSEQRYNSASWWQTTTYQTTAGIGSLLWNVMPTKEQAAKFAVQTVVNIATEGQAVGAVLETVKETAKVAVINAGKDYLKAQGITINEKPNEELNAPPKANVTDSYRNELQKIKPSTEADNDNTNEVKGPQ